MAQSDYQLALLLQKQFEHEASIDNPTNNLSYSKNKYKLQEKSLVDPSWELIDPTPNIYTLFIAFDTKYFWNSLQAVCVDWSKRMTSCAGICSYSGRGGLCRITLSEPLLKLRPRKDLIETLLHEMIHAYLFVTANNKDRDGHGPEFHKHMYRINSQAGTNISVYHDFIDEVRLYQQHWWRCDGPCQHKKPYFGMVRRATNRAPGPNDRWWDEHSRSCGGNFIKVKEPEKPTRKATKVATNKTTTKITINKYFPVLKEKTANANSNYKSSNVVGFGNFSNKGGSTMRTNANGTIVITKKPALSTTSISKPTSKTTIVSAITRPTSKNNDDYAPVRNHWINKYPNNSNTTQTKRTIQSDDEEKNDDKRHKPNDHDTVKCPICEEDIQLSSINCHIDNCLENMPEYSQKLLQQSHDVVTNQYEVEDDIQVSCLVCSKNILKSDLNSHLDECMGEDIFKSTDHSSDIRNDGDMEKKYNCPVCFQMFYVNEMSDHLNTCLVNDTVFDEPF